MNPQEEVLLQCSDCGKQLKTRQGLYGHCRLKHGQQHAYSKSALAEIGGQVIAAHKAFANLLKEKPELASLLNESQEFLLHAIALSSQGIKLRIRIDEPQDTFPLEAH